MINWFKKIFNKWLGKYLSVARMDYMYVNGHTKRQRIFVFSILGIVAILFVHAMILARTEPVNIHSTKLGTTQTIGYNSNNINLRVDNVRYNEKNNLLAVDLSGQNGNSITMTGNELSVVGKLSAGKGDYRLIPTTNNHWTVLFNNMPKTWGAVEVDLHSNMPSSPTAVSQTDDKNTDGRLRFVQSNIKTDKNLDNTSAQKIVEVAINKQITSLNNQIADRNKSIDEANTLIDFDKSKITDLQKDQDLQNASEKAKGEKSAETLQKEIDDQTKAITTWNKEITRKQTQLAQDKDKLIRVQTKKLPDYKPHKTEVLKLGKAEK